MMASEWHQLARQGTVSEMRQLLSSPVARKMINGRDQFSQTPLHIAAFDGNLEKVKLLLENGAEIDATDKNQWSPLHCASNSGNIMSIFHFSVL
jgi:ankyrin repeat protein